MTVAGRPEEPIELHWGGKPLIWIPARRNGRRGDGSAPRLITRAVGHLGPLPDYR